MPLSENAPIQVNPNIDSIPLGSAGPEMLLESWVCPGMLRDIHYWYPPGMLTWNPDSISGNAPRPCYFMKIPRVQGTCRMFRLIRECCCNGLTVCILTLVGGMLGGYTLLSMLQLNRWCYTYRLGNRNPANDSQMHTFLSMVSYNIYIYTYIYTIFILWNYILCYYIYNVLILAVVAVSFPTIPSGLSSNAFKVNALCHLRDGATAMLHCPLNSSDVVVHCLLWITKEHSEPWKDAPFWTLTAMLTWSTGISKWSIIGPPGNAILDMHLVQHVGILNRHWFMYQFSVFQPVGWDEEFSAWHVSRE